MNVPMLIRFVFRGGSPFRLLSLVCILISPLQSVAQNSGVGDVCPAPSCYRAVTGAPETHAERVAFLRGLGLDAETVIQVDADGFSPDSVVEPMRSSSGRIYGLLALPCSTNLSAALYLLERSGGGEWRTADRVYWSCFDENPTHSITSLVPHEDTILVEHVNSGHGTDMVQDDIQLYGVSSGKLRKLFSTVDYVCDSTWMPVGSVISEKTSSFLKFPSNRLEETRVTSRNHRLIKIERRVWNWSPAQKTMVSSRFRTVTY
jgi:hypothetical protein